MTPADEWLLLKLAALRIGEAWLLRAPGALRGVPHERIFQEALRIGKAKLNQAQLEGTLRLRGVKRGTDEEVDILGSAVNHFSLDYFNSRLARLSSRGGHGLTEYDGVKVRLADVERLEREAEAQSPPAPDVDPEKKAARAEAAVALRAAMSAKALAKASATALAKTRDNQAREEAKRQAEAVEAERQRLTRETLKAEAQAAVERLAREAEDVEQPAPPKAKRGRPRGGDTVAMRDADAMTKRKALDPDNFEIAYKRELEKTMSKPSAARRIRNAKPLMKQPDTGK